MYTFFEFLFQRLYFRRKIKKKLSYNFKIDFFGLLNDSDIFFSQQCSEIKDKNLESGNN